MAAATGSVTLTASLNINQLRSSASQAQRILNELHMPDITAGASGDINNLLASLTRYEQLARQLDSNQPLTSAQAQEATQLESTITHLRDTINESLNSIRGMDLSTLDLSQYDSQIATLQERVESLRSSLQSISGDFTSFDLFGNGDTVDNLIRGLTNNNVRSRIQDAITDIFNGGDRNQFATIVEEQIARYEQALANARSNGGRVPIGQLGSGWDESRVQREIGSLYQILGSGKSFFRLDGVNLRGYANSINQQIQNSVLGQGWKGLLQTQLGNGDFQNALGTLNLGIQSNGLNQADFDNIIQQLTIIRDLQNDVYNSNAGSRYNNLAGNINTNQQERIRLENEARTRIRDTTGRLGQIDGNLNEGGTSLATMSDGLAQFNQQANQLRSRVSTFFSLGNAFNLLKRTASSAFNTIKKLDQVMTETAVVTNYTVSDMWGQLDKYTELANQLGATTQGAYETMTLFYQQGLNSRETFEVGTEAMKMAKIAGMDYANATDMMTAALRGFNMELDADSAQRINDVYSELAAKTAASTQEIAKAMTKTASIANSAGMSFENTSAFLTQIIETTREAPETAGTALKTVIARFSEVKELFSKGQLTGTDTEGEAVDINKIDTALKKVGISLNDFLLGNEGLDSVFLRLAEKWDTIDTATQRYIATMAAGSRQQSRFLAMMSDYDRTLELVNLAENAEGASNEQFSKTLDSLDAKLNQLKNSWDEFTMSLIDSSTVKSGVDMLTDLLNIVNKLTGSFGNSFGTTAKVAGVAGIVSFAQGLVNRRNLIEGQTQRYINDRNNPMDAEQARAQATEDYNRYKRGARNANIGGRFTGYAVSGVAAGLGALWGYKAKTMKENGTGTETQIAQFEQLSSTASTAATAISTVTMAMSALGVSSPIMIAATAIIAIVAGVKAWRDYQNEAFQSLDEQQDTYKEMATDAADAVTKISKAYEDATSSAKTYYELQQKLAGLQKGTLEYYETKSQLEGEAEKGQRYGYLDEFGNYSEEKAIETAERLKNSETVAKYGKNVASYASEYFGRKSYTVKEIEEETGITIGGYNEEEQEASRANLLKYGKYLVESGISSENMTNAMATMSWIAAAGRGMDANGNSASYAEDAFSQEKLINTIMQGGYAETYQEAKGLANLWNRLNSDGDVTTNGRGWYTMSWDFREAYDYLGNIENNGHMTDFINSLYASGEIADSEAYKTAQNASLQKLTKSLFTSDSSIWNTIASNYVLDSSELFNPEKILESINLTGINVDLLSESKTQMDDERKAVLSRLTGNSISYYDEEEYTSEDLVNELKGQLAAAALIYENFNADEFVNAVRDGIDYELNPSEMKKIMDSWETFSLQTKEFLLGFEDLNYTDIQKLPSELNKYQSQIYDQWMSGMKTAVINAQDKAAEVVDVRALDWMSTSNVVKSLSISQVGDIGNLVQTYGSNLSRGMGEAISYIFGSHAISGETTAISDLIESLDVTSGTSVISFMKNLQEARAENGTFYAADYNLLENELKSGNWQTQALSELYNSSTFSDTLESLNKTLKSGGTIDGSDILEAADDCEILNNWLTACGGSATALADILTQVNEGTMDMSDVTDRMISAFSTASSVENSIATARNDIKQWEDSAPESSSYFDDTFKSIAKGITTELSSGRLGSETLNYYLDMLGIKDQYYAGLQQGGNTYAGLQSSDFATTLNVLTSISENGISGSWGNIGDIIGSENKTVFDRFFSWDGTSLKLNTDYNTLFSEFTSEDTGLGQLGSLILGQLYQQSPALATESKKWAAENGLNQLKSTGFYTEQEAEAFYAEYGDYVTEAKEDLLKDAYVADSTKLDTLMSAASQKKVNGESIDWYDLISSTLGIDSAEVQKTMAGLINPDGSLNNDILTSGLTKWGFDGSDVKTLITTLQDSGYDVEDLETSQVTGAIDAQTGAIVSAISALGAIFHDNALTWEQAVEQVKDSAAQEAKDYLESDKGKQEYNTPEKVANYLADKGITADQYTQYGFDSLIADREKVIEDEKEIANKLAENKIFGLEPTYDNKWNKDGASLENLVQKKFFDTQSMEDQWRYQIGAKDLIKDSQPFIKKAGELYNYIYQLSNETISDYNEDELSSIVTQNPDRNSQELAIEYILDAKGINSTEARDYITRTMYGGANFKEATNSYFNQMPDFVQEYLNESDSTVAQNYLNKDEYKEEIYTAALAASQGLMFGGKKFGELDYNSQMSAIHSGYVKLGNSIFTGEYAYTDLPSGSYQDTKTIMETNGVSKNSGLYSGIEAQLNKQLFPNAATDNSVQRNFDEAVIGALREAGITYEGYINSDEGIADIQALLSGKKDISEVHFNSQKVKYQDQFDSIMALASDEGIFAGDEYKELRENLVAYATVMREAAENATEWNDFIFVQDSVEGIAHGDQIKQIFDKFQKAQSLVSLVKQYETASWGDLDEAAQQELIALGKEFGIDFNQDTKFGQDFYSKVLETATIAVGKTQNPDYQYNVKDAEQLAATTEAGKDTTINTNEPVTSADDVKNAEKIKKVVKEFADAAGQAATKISSLSKDIISSAETMATIDDKIKEATKGTLEYSQAVWNKEDATKTAYEQGITTIAGDYVEQQAIEAAKEARELNAATQAGNAIVQQQNRLRQSELTYNDIVDLGASSWFTGKTYSDSTEAANDVISFISTSKDYASVISEAQAATTDVGKILSQVLKAGGLPDLYYRATQTNNGHKLGQLEANPSDYISTGSAAWNSLLVSQYGEEITRTANAAADEYSRKYKLQEPKGNFAGGEYYHLLTNPEGSYDKLVSYALLLTGQSQSYYSDWDATAVAGEIETQVGYLMANYSGVTIDAVMKGLSQGLTIDKIIEQNKWGKTDIGELNESYENLTDQQKNAVDNLNDITYQQLNNTFAGSDYEQLAQRGWLSNASAAISSQKLPTGFKANSLDWAATSLINGKITINQFKQIGSALTNITDTFGLEIGEAVNTAMMGLADNPALFTQFADNIESALENGEIEFLKFSEENAKDATISEDLRKAYDYVANAFKSSTSFQSDLLSELYDTDAFSSTLESVEKLLDAGSEITGSGILSAADSCSILNDYLEVSGVNASALADILNQVGKGQLSINSVSQTLVDAFNTASGFENLIATSYSKLTTWQSNAPTNSDFSKFVTDAFSSIQTELKAGRMGSDTLDYYMKLFGLDTSELSGVSSYNELMSKETWQERANLFTQFGEGNYGRLWTNIETIFGSDIKSQFDKMFSVSTTNGNSVVSLNEGMTLANFEELGKTEAGQALLGMIYSASPTLKKNVNTALAKQGLNKFKPSLGQSHKFYTREEAEAYQKEYGEYLTESDKTKLAEIINEGYNADNSRITKLASIDGLERALALDPYQGKNGGTYYDELFGNLRDENGYINLDVLTKGLQTLGYSTEAIDTYVNNLKSTNEKFTTDEASPITAAIGDAASSIVSAISALGQLIKNDGSLKDADGNEITIKDYVNNETAEEQANAIEDQKKAAKELENAANANTEEPEVDVLIEGGEIITQDQNLPEYTKTIEEVQTDFDNLANNIKSDATSITAAYNDVSSAASNLVSAEQQLADVRAGSYDYFQNMWKQEEAIDTAREQGITTALGSYNELAAISQSITERQKSESKDIGVQLWQDALQWQRDIITPSDLGDEVFGDLAKTYTSVEKQNLVDALGSYILTGRTSEIDLDTDLGKLFSNIISNGKLDEVTARYQAAASAKTVAINPTDYIKTGNTVWDSIVASKYNDYIAYHATLQSQLLEQELDTAFNRNSSNELTLAGSDIGRDKLEYYVALLTGETLDKVRDMDDASLIGEYTGAVGNYKLRYNSPTTDETLTLDEINGWLDNSLGENGILDNGETFNINDYVERQNFFGKLLNSFNELNYTQQDLVKNNKKYSLNQARSAFYGSDYADEIEKAYVSSSQDLWHDFQSQTTGKIGNIGLSDEEWISAQGAMSEEQVQQFQTSMLSIADNFGIEVATSSAENMLREFASSGNTGFLDEFTSKVDTTNIITMYRSVQKEADLATKKQLGYADEWEEQREAMSQYDAGDMITALMNDDGFSSTLTSLTNIAEAFGEINGDSIMEAAESCETLQDFLDTDIMYAQTLADVLAQITLGDIGADQVTDDLINALNLANAVDNWIDEAKKRVNDWKENRPETDEVFYTTLVESATNIKNARDKGGYGDQAFWYDMDMWGLGRKLANTMGNLPEFNSLEDYNKYIENTFSKEFEIIDDVAEGNTTGLWKNLSLFTGSDFIDSLKSDFDLEITSDGLIKFGDELDSIDFDALSEKFSSLGELGDILWGDFLYLSGDARAKFNNQNAQKGAAYLLYGNDYGSHKNTKGGDYNLNRGEGEDYQFRTQSEVQAYLKSVKGKVDDKTWEQLMTAFYGEAKINTKTGKKETDEERINANRKDWYTVTETDGKVKGKNELTKKDFENKEAFSDYLANQVTGGAEGDQRSKIMKALFGTDDLSSYVFEGTEKLDKDRVTAALEAAGYNSEYINDFLNNNSQWLATASEAQTQTALFAAQQLSNAGTALTTAASQLSAAAAALNPNTGDTSDTTNNPLGTEGIREEKFTDTTSVKDKEKEETGISDEEAVSTWEQTLEAMTYSAFELGESANSLENAGDETARAAENVNSNTEEMGINRTEADEETAEAYLAGSDLVNQIVSAGGTALSTSSVLVSTGGIALIAAAPSVVTGGNALSNAAPNVKTGGSKLSAAAEKVSEAAGALSEAAANLKQPTVAFRHGKIGSQSFRIPGYAKGRSIPRLGHINTTPPRDYEGVAQVGEEGPELIVGPNGTYLAGVHGQTFTYLHKDDSVYTAQETRKILGDNSHNIPGFAGGTKDRIDIPGFAVKGGRENQSSGSSSSSEKEKSDTPYENKLDKLQNLIEHIDKTTRDIKTIENDRNEWEFELDHTTNKNDYNSIFSEYLDSFTNTLKTSTEQIKNYNTRIEGRKLQLEELQYDMQRYSKYAYYDTDLDEIVYDWQMLENVKDSDYGKDIDEYIDDLEGIVKDIHDSQDKITELEKSIRTAQETLEKKIDDNQKQYREQIDGIRDAIVDFHQDEIDKLSDLYDAQDENNSSILDNMQKVIDEQRKLRDLQDSKDDLEEKQRRLALLKRDSSGANAVEIKKLEEEIEDDQEGYVDSLVDYSLEQLQDANDVASEQRQQQIDLLQEILDFQEENGYFNQQAEELFNGLYDENGDINWDSAYVKLMQYNDDYAAMTEEEQEEWRTTFAENNVKAQSGQQAYEDDYDTALWATYEATKEDTEADILDKMQYYWSKDDINAEDLEDPEKAKIILERYIDKWGAILNDVEENLTSGQLKEELDSAEEKLAKAKAAVDADDTAENREAYESALGIYNTKKNRYDEATEYRDMYKELIQEMQDKLYEDYGIPLAANGGLFDTTGLMQIDGTASKPELVLNPDDTKNFLSVVDTMRDLDTNSLGSGTTYFDIHIDVDKLSSDYDVEQVANKIKSMITADASYRNNNVLNFIR